MMKGTCDGQMNNARVLSMNEWKPPSSSVLPKLVPPYRQYAVCSYLNPHTSCTVADAKTTSSQGFTRAAAHIPVSADAGPTLHHLNTHAHAHHRINLPPNRPQHTVRKSCNFTVPALPPQIPAAAHLATKCSDTPKAPNASSHTQGSLSHLVLIHR